MHVLLGFGLLFPVVSLLSTIAAHWESRRHGRHCSAILIPFVGPIMLTWWVVADHQPTWLIPISWITDLGTIAFLSVSPGLAREWWNTSSWTRLLALEGHEGRETINLSLHSGGHYLLEKQWKLSPGETGMVSSSEVGTYVQDGATYSLVTDGGPSRILQEREDSSYLLSEKAGTEPRVLRVRRKWRPN